MTQDSASGSRVRYSYVLVADLDHSDELLGLFEHKHDAERICAAARDYHANRPKQAQWSPGTPEAVAANNKAWDDWYYSHPAGADNAHRCVGFHVHPVPWINVTAWETPA
ncbi:MULTISPECIES: hypothetical protein [unclassified Pseudomonas]|uniref:hypothetical protein n=1 Tax=unclassified Pseudomonas TaxID=196821 RepID=UPI002361B485|nr:MULTISPECIES: hypothetical protein [unclassified Pseudomonas]